MMRSYSLRIRASPAQRELLRRWMHAGRVAYDTLLARHREAPDTTPLHLASVTRLMHASERATWMTDAGIPPEEQRRIPRCIPKRAMLDLVTAEKGGQTKRRRRPHSQPGTYRGRSQANARTQTVHLEAAQFHVDDPHHERAPKDAGPVLRIRRVPNQPADRKRPSAHVYLGSGMKALGPVTVKDQAWLIDTLARDQYLLHAAKLRWTRPRDAFHLCVTLKRTPPADPDPEGSSKRVVILDPGVRHFQTFYEPATGTHGVLLAGYTRIDHHGQPVAGSANASVMDELIRRGDRIATLQRRCTRTAPPPPRGLPPGRAPRRWLAEVQAGRLPRKEFRRRCWRRRKQGERHARRLCDRERERRDRFKHHMHYASIAFLWKHWDVVVPSTANLMEAAKAPHQHDVRRRAANWSHYAWRQRLESSAFLRAGALVCPTDEAYTTQTCGRCGELNPRVGAATVFRCPRCGVAIDRDVNGARNIGLRLWTRLQADGGRW